ncbi:MAG: potassium-transporting ATPase subunit KdpC [Myxococcota bacterium]
MKWSREFRAAGTVLCAFTLLTGVAYPLLMTGVAQVIAPDKANGSLVRDAHGEVIGSRLIGQGFARPDYFWSRPSAAGSGWDAMASSGSNYAVGHPDQLTAVKARIDALHAADPGNTRAIPVDLVTASGSGLDPDITPAAALYQVPRVARLRHRSEREVEALVNAHIEGRALGVLGEPRVNVLELNLALDALPADSVVPK